ncbi:T9SS C-terminal target domain-containing protein [Christiangramia portivictoriae]|uniref:T9SS type B sorting domain-containing protein n=1 Tax=Christiangramia portivictoriae TaxID=326069 RepID=UPI00041C4B31|nr:T9SS C-terminal target domain-containing protein [Christiangramia portivictoriae]
MKLKVILALFLLPTFIYSQQEAANWYFGVGAGLSFTSGEAVPLTNGVLNTVEGSASISDRNGNLLFYTDGSTVYNRNHEVMLNGNDLKGNVSSTQSAIIIPKPANPGFYYIFTVDKPDYFRVTNDPIEGVHFSEVDMSMDNGDGGIVLSTKNTHLVTYDPSDPLEKEFKSSEKISAVIAGDCVSYWVVTQFTNKFYSFRVSAAGVNTSPVVSTINNNFPPRINEQDLNVTAPGYLKISPDGKFMAAAYSGTSIGSPRSGGAKKTGKVFLYDFNDLNGRVSNEKLLLANAYPYGVEFSPESSKLYATSNNYNTEDVLQNGELYQFDLEATDIAGSATLINSSRNVAGALQLAPNGKIYRAGYSTDGGFVRWNLLSVIHNPEENAADVDYRHNSLDISPKVVRLGLPPFVQSLFNSNFEYENSCLGQVTEFTAEDAAKYDSFLWEFGDGATSTAASPSHTYNAAGTYTVSLTGIINGIPQDPVCEEVTIFEIPEVPSGFVLKQCDVQDSDPTDGIATFNLQLAKEELSEGQSGIQLYFYGSEADAISDVNNELTLDDIYRNTIPNEQIFVKISGFGSDCYDIGSFRLQTTESVDLTLDSANGCDLGDGTAAYDLATIAANARIDLGLSANVHLSFHASEDDAILGSNALPAEYITTPKTLYIRADADNICYGFGSIELEMISFPAVQSLLRLDGCAADFPLTLGEDLDLANPDAFTYLWSTGETGKTIEVNDAGIYSLQLTLRESGCRRSIDFNIEKYEAPQISEIGIVNNGNENDLTIYTNSEVENTVYALDDINGPYQSNPVFRSVPGGQHTVYVRNSRGCATGEMLVYLYGHPPFFTPNNDGSNDLWKPYDISEPGFRFEKMVIFDRYGKILSVIPKESKGWDGEFNGKPMPADDYWFEVKLENGKTFKGHFSLIRE